MRYSWYNRNMNNEPLGSYERNIMNKTVNEIAVYLEARAELAKRDRDLSLDRAKNSEIIYHAQMDDVFELDAKYYAAKYALNHLEDLLEGGEFYEDLEADEIIKTLRDRILYRITSESQVKSTSVSHNMIETARHFALIDILNAL